MNKWTDIEGVPSYSPIECCSGSGAGSSCEPNGLVFGGQPCNGDAVGVDLTIGSGPISVADRERPALVLRGRRRGWVVLHKGLS